MPGAGAVILVSIFIASSTSSTSPVWRVCPTCAATRITMPDTGLRQTLASSTGLLSPAWGRARSRSRGHAHCSGSHGQAAHQRRRRGWFYSFDLYLDMFSHQSQYSVSWRLLIMQVMGRLNRHTPLLCPRMRAEQSNLFNANAHSKVCGERGRNGDQFFFRDFRFAGAGGSGSAVAWPGSALASTASGFGPAASSFSTRSESAASCAWTRSRISAKSFIVVLFSGHVFTSAL